MIVAYNSKNEFFGKFENENELIAFLRWDYEEHMVPKLTAQGHDVPPTAEECERQYIEEGKWEGWLKLCGVIYKGE